MSPILSRSNENRKSQTKKIIFVPVTCMKNDYSTKHKKIIQIFFTPIRSKISFFETVSTATLTMFASLSSTCVVTLLFLVVAHWRDFLWDSKAVLFNIIVFFFPSFSTQKTLSLSTHVQHVPLRVFRFYRFLFNVIWFQSTPVIIGMGFCDAKPTPPFAYQYFVAGIDTLKEK